MKTEIGKKFKEYRESRQGKVMTFVFACVMCLFFVPQVNAFNPQITYQGKLTDSSGNAVSNGTYYIKATIYNASSSGTCVYTASSTTSGNCTAVTSTPITVTSGIFSISLGDTSASLNSLSSTMFTTSSLYLGITVCSGPGSGCDSEMTPRKRLTASPYAFDADYLGGVTTSTIGGTGSYIPATDNSGNLKITNSLFVATSTAGQFGVGTTTIPSGAKEYVESPTASDKLLVIRGNSSQTGNLLELQNNSGRALGFFDPNGYLSVGSGSVTSTLQSASLIVGQATSYNQGKFYVDGSTGNTSASGTLQTAGQATFGAFGTGAGFLSTASSTVTGGLNVAGNLSASSTITIGGNILPSIANSNSYSLGLLGQGLSNIFASSSVNVSNGTASSTLNPNYLSIGDGTLTSIFYGNTITIGQSISKSFGIFYIDHSGNTSASGTLQTAGQATFGAFGTGAGFLSTASSTVTGGLNVAGNLSASSTITIKGNILANNNFSNLGIYGNAFAHAFVSSTITLGSGTSNDKTIFAGNELTFGINDVTQSQGVFYINSSGNTSVSGTLQVYGGASTGGFSVSSTNSTTTFMSNATNAQGSGAFVFNTLNSFTSTTAGTPLDRVIFAVASANTNKFAISGGGNVYATKGFNANSTEYGIGDFAENVTITQGEKVEPGDVIMADTAHPGMFKKSNASYLNQVAGVISDTGAFVIGASGEHRATLGMTGLVHTNVITENGPIQPGDYLVSSSKPGYAMKYDPASGHPAGLVGMALEPLISGEGKIVVMVNKGYMAGSAGGSLGLQASIGADGKLSAPVDLNLADKSIINVSTIVGSKGKWRIDENGVLTNTIKTAGGTKTVFNQQSPDAEIVLSGSGQLQNGIAQITFDQDTQDIISDQVSLKVSVTLTGDSKGIFVSEKSIKGFTVKEIQGGTGNTTFDWTAIARRKGYENGSPSQSTDTLSPAPADAGQSIHNTSASVAPKIESPSKPTDNASSVRAIDTATSTHSAPSFVSVPNQQSPADALSPVPASINNERISAPIVPQVDLPGSTLSAPESSSAVSP